MKLRLHQFLSKTGEFKSKKDVFDAIENGFVAVLDKVITNPHYQFNVNKKVTYKGNRLVLGGEKKYFILNKPAGYLSSRLTPNDKGKKSLFELLPQDNSLFTAGRLDEDSSGLIIVTNDGKLSKRITSPESGIEKTYRVLLETPLLDYSEIEKGIIIELEENAVITKYKTQPAVVKKISDKEVLITITEGKKREVRRIFEAVGNKVISLERISIGKIRLSDLSLKPGAYRKTDRVFIEKRLVDFR